MIDRARSAFHRRYLVPAMLVCILSAWPCPAATQAPSGDFWVVVHESNPVTELTADRLSRIFLRKLDRWDDGARIAVVDQAADSRLYGSFATAVHRRSSAAVVSYWQQQIFSGRKMPPPVQKTDRAVLAFVSGDAHAIGYIARSTPIGPGVKVVGVSSERDPDNLAGR